MDFLEFSDICAEIKGAMCPGRLKLTDQHIVFKNSKTGKVEQVSPPDIEVLNWQRLVGSWGLRIFLKNGTLHRFGGIKDSEQEKIAKFFTSNYKKDVLEKELSLKGWNWGTAKFDGSALSFDVGNHTGFEIPLNYVSQCTTGKNEVTLEFHQNDDASVGLMEMRFHIPASELAGDVDPVDAFHQQVMKQASVINLSGDAITTFKEIQCLTPRGRYDIKIFQSFFQLHGKTFDYKIPMSTVIRLFILPHKDSRQMFYVVSLDPPIKQGQTRYHYLVFQFGQENEVTVELPLSEEEIQEKYEGKLGKTMTGPTYEILGRVMKAIVNRKITTPGNFIGHSGTPAIGCSYKAAAGYLYPLERGFIYIHKPPVHLRFDEITSVNFARSGGGTRSFDFEVETKSGVVHTFSSIEKDEYAKLFDFITSKKLRVKNRGKNDKPSYTEDFGDSDQEEPDAYLARVKAEAQERDDDDGGDSEESTDEDFNPDQQESDVAEEYDSNPTPTDSDDSDESGSEKKKEKKKEKKEHVKKTKTVSEKPRRKREPKKERDANRPKRPATAFMLWLNEHREQIKSENPGITVTEIAKKAGEMWKEIKDKSVWEGKVMKAKEEYAKAMKEYNESGLAAKAAGDSKKEKKETKKKTPSKPSPVKSGAYKSKEYISDDDSSSDDDKKKKKTKKPAIKKGSKSGSDDSSSGDDKKKKQPAAKPATKPTVTKEPKSGSDESGSDSKKPAAKKIKTDDVKKEKESDDDNIDEPIESTPPTTEDDSGSGSD